MPEPAETAAPAGSWIPYFGVEKAEGAHQKAEQRGGRTLAAPTDSPTGRTALLADPQGATFALLELSDTSSRQLGA